MGELIVVGIDGSPDSRAALRWAAKHAVRLGCRLLVVHVWTPIPKFTELPPRRRAQLEHDRARGVEDAQRRVAEALHEVGVSSAHFVDTLVVDGSPAANLVRLGNGAEQIVLGATGYGTPQGQMRPPLGSTVRYVLRHAHCPVTVVSGQRVPARAETPPHAATASSVAFR
jgi:nucleotide-binding universal stress UspA family protein